MYQNPRYFKIDEEKEKIKRKRDDPVSCSPFGERCRGRTITNTKTRLQVVLGHALVEVSFDDVSWIDPPPGSDG